MEVALAAGSWPVPSLLWSSDTSTLSPTDPSLAHVLDPWGRQTGTQFIPPPYVCGGAGRGVMGKPWSLEAQRSHLT